jgi:16S rRNA (uracil1498-N3)-methyltransferase
VGHLFFVDEIDSTEVQLLEGEEAHHAIKVLRLSQGEQLVLSDGKMNWISGKVSEIGRKSLKIKVDERGSLELPAPELIVVQAFTKSDRSKEMLELLTVSGVNQIIPWDSERSISKWQPDSADKWRLTVREACKQSKRLRLPTINNPMKIEQILGALKNNFSVVFHESSGNKFSKIEIPDGIKKIYIVIGPEGGITDSEIEMFRSSGSVISRLGEPILRSAHAGFAALSALQTRIGRW